MVVFKNKGLKGADWSGARTMGSLFAAKILFIRPALHSGCFFNRDKNGARTRSLFLHRQPIRPTHSRSIKYSPDRIVIR